MEHNSDTFYMKMKAFAKYLALDLSIPEWRKEFSNFITNWNKNAKLMGGSENWNFENLKIFKTQNDYAESFLCKYPELIEENIRK